MNGISKIKTVVLAWYESLPGDIRQLLEKCFRVFIVAFIFVLIYSAGSKASTYNAWNHTNFTFLHFIFFDFSVYPSSLFLSFLIVVLYVLFVYKKYDFRNQVKTVHENKKFEVTKKATSGSADFMTLAEAMKAYEVCENGKTTAMTFGKLKAEMDPAQRIVAYKPKPYQADGSGLQNVLYFGHSGSGKSFGFVRTEIMNSILRGDSLYISDPSGELFTTYGQYCKSLNINTKLLNLIDTNHSDSWNCLQECIEPATGRLDGARLNMFADVFINNANGGQKEDTFWHNQNLGYLKAAIGYVAWERENSIMSNYRVIFRKVSKGINKADSILKAFRDLTPLTWCEKMIRLAASANGYRKEDIDRVIKLAQDTAPKFNLEEVYNLLYDFDKADIAYKGVKEKGVYTAVPTIPFNHPGRRAYDSVRRENTKADVIESSLSGILNKFSLFVDGKLLYNLSRDGISSDDLNKKQSVFFISMNTEQTEMQPILSLFTTFLLRNAEISYNTAQQLAVEKGIRNTRKDVTLMLDEFASLGLIGGNEQWFPQFLANSRKAHMHTSILTQSIGMLRAVYGDVQTNNIASNCEMTCVLSANDQDTCEYISQFLGGVATVWMESHNVNVGIINRNASNEANVSSGSRPLMTVDEVRRQKESILLVKHGEQPLELDTLPYTEHVLYEQLKDKKQSVSTAIPSYYQKLGDELEAEEKKKKETDKKKTDVLAAVDDEEFKPVVPPIKNIDKIFENIKFVDPDKTYTYVFNQKSGIYEFVEFVDDTKFNEVPERILNELEKEGSADDSEEDNIVHVKRKSRPAVSEEVVVISRKQVRKKTDTSSKPAAEVAEPSSTDNEEGHQMTIDDFLNTPEEVPDPENQAKAPVESTAASEGVSHDKSDHEVVRSGKPAGRIRTKPKTREPAVKKTNRSNLNF